MPPLFGVPRELCFEDGNDCQTNLLRWNGRNVMLVVVYAICKNEAKFVDRWMDSMGEADRVVVLDTGSVDNTVALLRARNAQVTVEEVCPWRFDTARNRALDLVPLEADICVCTDLDEIFRPGWRAVLEAAWQPGAGRARYRYTWSFTPEGQEDVVFWSEKIHARKGYRWVHPVHEILTYTGTERPGPWVWAGGVQLDHHPDPGKSREQYLKLLELAVAEAPEDDRNMHYLGREYMYRGRWEDCIHTLQRHLAMPTAVWEDERCASMRYLARANLMLGRRGEAKCWYLRAIAQAPHLREPYLDFAQQLYEEGDWDGVLYFTRAALTIRERAQTYITEAASWGSLPYDLQAVAYHRTGRIFEALRAARQALAVSPGDQRLAGNVACLERQLANRG